MLGDKRVLLRGRSDYAHEQEALEFIRGCLPDREPHLLWELIELVDPSTGNIHEIDALILGFRALYLVEIKSGPGVYRGDTVDWSRQPPGQNPRYMKPPLRLTNFKAKVLKSLLERRMPPRSVPWVQPLVFLSHPDIELQFKNYGDQCVVTRKTFQQAITHHKFPGSDMQRMPLAVTTPQIKQLLPALRDVGIRKSEGGLRVGTWLLTETLESGPGFVDRLAIHSENEKSLRRARSYLVPEQTSTERRQQLRRAASREAQLLEDVKGHPGILRINDFVSDADPGPTVLFDHFDGVPLDTFLRQNPALGFADRVALIGQVGRALDHCHKKEVYHGGLSPSAVLVGWNERSEVDTRLYNFQLGGGAQVSHTLHWSALADEEWVAYQAPELRENTASPRGPADIFSLGALAYFILTGRPPAESAADADARMKKDRHYDPLLHNELLQPGVAECIKMATDWLPSSRFESPGDFVEYLEEEATAPPADSDEQNPLEARKGDVLAGDYQVERVLGQGASSRVLRVKKLSDGRVYALKVALDETEDERLTEEAAVLGALRHQRIVQLYDAPVVGGRKCLLLALAGEQTLQSRLKTEGIISLDYAARFGEDLLLALEQLEEQDILHRDIKPANIGVGPVKKQANHLMLFDFSLGLDLKRAAPGRHERSQTGIGTVAYRDPYLVDRDGWDHAADRYSAAITLHEMLTGTRPAWEPEGASARDPEARLVLAEERFDAAVRDRLAAFFQVALAPTVAQRHHKAAAMRRAWNDCFAAISVPAPELVATSEHESPPPPSVGVSEQSVSPSAPPGPPDLATVLEGAPIAELPLSGRALNALDRAGVTRVGELASLPDNQLTAVRGVGAHVVREVIDVTQRWLAARDQATQLGAVAFYPGFGGADTALGETALDAQLVRVLADAGLSSLRKVASAPHTQVSLLLERAGAQPAELLALLQASHAAEEQRAHPTSVDGWLRALLPKQKKRAEHLQAILGLAGPLAGRTDVLVAHVAKALGLTAPALYIALGKCKEEWLRHEGFADLAAAAQSVVDRAGGALPIERAATLLLEHYPASPLLDELCPAIAPERRPVVAAAGLLRMVALVEREREQGLRWERLGGHPWLLASAGLIEPLLQLGDAADELAARDTIAASGETIRTLRAVAGASPFASLSDARLTELAAAASEHAALSTRLELYPRGMSAKRALGLSAASLVGKLKPEEVQKRVLARYPAAEPLPSRPELDGLLSDLKLLWDESTQTFARPDQQTGTSHTGLSTTYRTIPTEQRALHPHTIEASSFDEAMRIAIERGRFRVLAVRIDRVVDAATALAARFDLETIDLNRALWEAATRLMKQHGVPEAVVHAADLAGPLGDEWPQLVALMGQAAQGVLEDLLGAQGAQSERPRLFLNPGLIARYELDDFLRTLVERTRQSAAGAAFLLVPAPDAGSAVPLINDSFLIPEVGPPDVLPVSHAWLSQSKKAG